MDPQKTGNFILRLRKENNLTQADFADMFGVTFQAVSKWENGKNIPDILILKEICKKFNIDLNEILEVSPSPKNKIKSFYIIIGVVFLFLIVSLFIIFNKDQDFNFKTLSSNCSNFNINGSLAYNNNKSHIYISKIEYCGGNDTPDYKKIECILFESNGDIDKKIDAYTSDREMKLEDFLKNVTFHIDDYTSVCKDYIDSKLFLQIYATDELDKVTSYKIPLNYQTSCDEH